MSKDKEIKKQNIHYSFIKKAHDLFTKDFIE